MDLHQIGEVIYEASTGAHPGIVTVADAVAGQVQRSAVTSRCRNAKIEMATGAAV